MKLPNDRTIIRASSIVAAAGVVVLASQPFGDTKSFVNLGCTLAVEAVAVHTMINSNDDDDE